MDFVRRKASPDTMTLPSSSRHRFRPLRGACGKPIDSPVCQGVSPSHTPARATFVWTVPDKLLAPNKIGWSNFSPLSTCSGMSKPLNSMPGR